ncbi:DUF262 domain-containing protein [Reyranella sp.]|uniref:DUF262 domain-containing protein n=1 Tax=Reyranella sp. TaxID=1929291 RepID=UPI003BAA12BE
MTRRLENWSVRKLYDERAKMSFPEYQREKQLWPDHKKSLLVDSILRDIDIPKLYFNQLSGRAFEVVDGQQRLWSLWDFLDDEFEYKPDPRSRKGSHYSQLTATQKKAIQNYELQVIIFNDADDDYLRELFVRLQLGLLLNTGEKLHAAKGKMKQLIFSKLAGHQFIRNLGIPQRRFAKETLCAQICINSFTQTKLKRFARTRYDDLLSFFEEYADPKAKDLELFNQKSASIQRVLDLLGQCFGSNSKTLRNRSYILSLYLFLESIAGPKATLVPAEQKSFSAFSTKLWQRLSDEKRLGMDRANRELYVFETMLSSAPGEEYQIKRRHEKLEEFYAYFLKHGKIKGDK